MDDHALVDLLFEASSAAKDALDGLSDWGLNGERDGQYRLDVAADRAVLAWLQEAGMSILSEESGRTVGSLPLVAVVDPIDGSTNAHRGLPMYSTSICVFDDEGPWVGTVVDHVSGRRFHGIRGSGAWRDGSPISASGCRNLPEAILGVSGVLGAPLGSWQYRVLGCASLELCAVADGTLDGYVLVGTATLRPWDYLAGLLICREAGAAVSESDGRDPWIRHDAARRPIAAATAELLDAIQLNNPPEGEAQTQ